QGGRQKAGEQGREQRGTKKESRTPQRVPNPQGHRGKEDLGKLCTLSKRPEKRRRRSARRSGRRRRGVWAVLGRLSQARREGGGAQGVRKGGSERRSRRQADRRAAELRGRATGQGPEIHQASGQLA